MVLVTVLRQDQQWSGDLLSSWLPSISCELRKQLINLYEYERCYWEERGNSYWTVASNGCIPYRLLQCLWLATYSTESTVIKHNLQTTESNTVSICRCVGHCTQYTVRYTQNTVQKTKHTIHYIQFITHNTLYEIHYIQYTIHSAL